MNIYDLIHPEAVVADLGVSSKKHALQELARHASMLVDIPDREIFEIITERERLGTTGVGRGVAIPHGKIPGLEALVGVFARLKRPIDFDSVDDQPVDLIFLLLVPEGAGADHLKALALVSRILRDRDLCEKLRGSDSADALYALLGEAAAAAA